ncbi:MAG: calcium-binding protein, partial [Cyanothece sp. SIO2G6]|nr:calcium-binding protein [Cyanothece sp. SIO2G6]
DAAGNFTIVWQSDLIEQVGTDRNPGIFARRFNNSGTGFADEFTVSAPDSDERTESNPAIDMDSSGNTLITWTSFEVEGDTGFDIFAQQYDPAGTAVGSPFQVNADDQEDGNQTNAAVAVDPDGDAVVVFRGDLQSSNATPGDQDLFGQQVDLTDGTPPPTTDEPTDPGTGVDGADLVGTPERDVLIGDNDNNTISGQGGNDVLQGQGGADTINGDAGNDTISGGDGDDQLFGDSGRDRILGNSGADDIEGSGGGDILRGGSGDDFLRAGAGSDRLVGGDGDDCLNGGGGNDRLIGGSGSNILNGSSGRDLLIGRGSGSDTFVLLTNSGFDIIRNFDPTQDSLGFASNRLAQQAEFRTTNTGSLVRIGGRNVALVRGVDLNSVALDNILTVVTAEQISCEPSVS